LYSDSLFMEREALLYAFDRAIEPSIIQLDMR